MQLHIHSSKIDRSYTSKHNYIITNQIDNAVKQKWTTKKWESLQNKKQVKLKAKQEDKKDSLNIEKKRKRSQLYTYTSISNSYCG